MYEKILNEELTRDEKKKILKLMLRSQNFDNFMSLKFPTVKRYGCEGAESMMAFFSELFDVAPQNEIDDVCFFFSFIFISNIFRLSCVLHIEDEPIYY